MTGLGMPPEVMALLASAQGEYLGGLAASVTLQLVGALGTRVKRMFRPEPVEAAMRVALAMAFWEILDLQGCLCMLLVSANIRRSLQ